MAPLPPPDERSIYHFTHVNHLPSVIDGGALLADAVVGCQLEVEVGERRIKAARRRLQVTRPPGGHPCDYVPFYFAPRSPMLYKIARGGVDQYQDGQDPLFYLVSSIGAVREAGCSWLFSDGNCGATLTAYYDDLDRIDSAVDWPLQEQTMWRDTPEDPTRATRRAAEFLVHERVPWSVIHLLAVRTEATRTTVQTILDERGQSPPVTVRPGWYYNGAKYA